MDLDAFVQRRKTTDQPLSAPPIGKGRRTSKQQFYSVIDFQKLIEERRARSRKR